MGKGIQLVEPEVKRQMAEALGLDRVSDKTAAILTMASQGMSVDIAHKLVTGKDRLPDSTKCEIKKKTEKWLLSSPEMQKLAHNAAKKIIQGKPIIGKSVVNGEEHINVINPKGSDVTSVIDMVTKRTEPVKNSEPTGNTFNFVQINHEPQHIVPGHTPPVAIDIKDNNINELEE